MLNGVRGRPGKMLGGVGVLCLIAVAFPALLLAYRVTQHFQMLPGSTGPHQRLSSSLSLRLPAFSELGNQITKLAEIVSDKPQYKSRREVHGL